MLHRRTIGLKVKLLEIEDVKVYNGNKKISFLLRNTTDNSIRILKTKFHKVLPKPIKYKRFFGLIKRIAYETYMGDYFPIFSEIKLKPHGKCRITIKTIVPISKGKYRLYLEGEMIVGYAKTLLESRAEVKREFQVIHEISVNEETYKLKFVKVEFRE